VTESAGPGAAPRVLVSTDIGGTDPDDFQSMVHLLLYADVLDIEGLVSSPYGDGRVAHIDRVIDCYEQDWANLRAHDPRYPTGQALREVTRQGSHELAGANGLTGTTEGSEWIVACARRRDRRPLHVLVWGGLDDVAQALHDAPEIAETIRVHYIGGPNTMWSVEAYHYLEQQHPDVWMIESNSTYRGFFDGGDDDIDNAAFVREHAAGHGALGTFFADQLPRLKMGDSPTVTWVLDGARHPEQPGWGGRFVPIAEDRGSVFHGHTTARERVEVGSVVEIILPVPDGYAGDDVTRMVVDERARGPFPRGVVQDGVLRFRLSVYATREIGYRLESSHGLLDGTSGSFTAVPPAPVTAARPSSRHPRWWTDDPEPAMAIGSAAGARWVSRHRSAVLADFAARLDRCLG
jgi:hypothetical protein